MSRPWRLREKIPGVLCLCASLSCWGCAEEARLSPEQACSQGDHIQCDVLVERSAPAVSRLTAACQNGNAPVCKRLGDLYQNGHLDNLWVEQDLQKSREAYQFACEQGVLEHENNPEDLSVIFQGLPAVCMNLGRSVKDPRQAVKYYTYACSLGDQAGCALADQGVEGLQEINQQVEEHKARMEAQKESHGPGRLRLKLRRR